MGKEYQISYTFIAMGLWDMILELEGTPYTFPPPINVDMYSPSNARREADGNAYFRLGEINSSWATGKNIKNVEVITPCNYYVNLFHNTFLDCINDKKMWNGNIPFKVAYMFVMHTIIHEYCHYIRSFYHWDSNNKKRDNKAFKESLKSYYGSRDDEYETERLTLQFMRKCLYYEYFSPENTGLDMIWNGRFAKWKYDEDDRLLISIFNYFQFTYELTYYKLSEDERDLLRSRIADIIEFQVEYAKKHKEGIKNIIFKI